MRVRSKATPDARRAPTGEDPEEAGAEDLAENEPPRDVCPDCEGGGTAYWESACGTLWELACPACTGYLDRGGNIVYDRKGSPFKVDWRTRQ